MAGKKRLIFLILLLIFGFCRRQPRANGYDITGKWELDISVTTPSKTDLKALADFFQEPNGRVTGTVSDTKGQYQKEITGQVTGNHFKIDNTKVSGRYLIITYEAEGSLEGTISEDSNQMAGNISGQATKPMSSPISGTFQAKRTSAPPPTATSSPAIPGDVNNDGHVNMADYAIFVSKYGTNDSTCDFNKNNLVDMGDYSIFVGNYGK